MACAGEAAAAAAAPSAQGAPRIVLVTDERGTRVAAMLRSELKALGMDVVEQAQPANEVLPRDLTAAARNGGAIAAFRVLVAPSAVEVWIADRVTGKVVLREVLPQGVGSTVEDSVVVLRAVELLRASLAEVEAPHPPRGELAAPPGSERITGFPDSAERFSLTLAPAGLFSPGGAGGSAALLAAFGWRASRWWSLGLLGGASLTAAKVVSPEGTVAIWSRWLGLELAVATPPGSASGRWRVRVGVGGALVATDLRGHLAPSSAGLYRTSENVLLSPALTLSTGLSYRLSRNLRLGATLCAAAPWRSPTIVIAGRDAATYGAPIIAAAIGVEAVWP